MNSRLTRFSFAVIAVAFTGALLTIVGLASHVEYIAYSGAIDIWMRRIILASVSMIQISLSFVAGYFLLDKAERKLTAGINAKLACFFALLFLMNIFVRDFTATAFFVPLFWASSYKEMKTFPLYDWILLSFVLAFGGYTSHNFIMEQSIENNMFSNSELDPYLVLDYSIRRSLQYVIVFIYLRMIISNHLLPEVEQPGAGQ